MKLYKVVIYKQYLLPREKMKNGLNQNLEALVYLKPGPP